MLFPKLDWGKVGDFEQHGVTGGIKERVWMLPRRSKGLGHPNFAWCWGKNAGVVTFWGGKKHLSSS